MTREGAHEKRFAMIKPWPVVGRGEEGSRRIDQRGGGDERERKRHSQARWLVAAVVRERFEMARRGSRDASWMDASAARASARPPPTRPLPAVARCRYDPPSTRANSALLCRHWRAPTRSA